MAWQSYENEREKKGRNELHKRKVSNRHVHANASSSFFKRYWRWFARSLVRSLAHEPIPTK